MRTSQKQIAPTVYQRKSLVDDSVVGVTMLHLELTNNSAATSITFGQAADILQKGDSLLANNVIAYLQNASNKRLALETYTKNISKTVAQSDQTVSSLQLDYDNASTEYQQCSSDKQAADNQFFQGLGAPDAALMQQGYDDALRFGTCETRSRISTNVYQAVIQRMQGYADALRQMENLLTTNEDLIVANVDLFKDSYLEQLIQIRDELEARG